MKTRKKVKPRIAISLGDFNGIGYEIVIKALRRKDVQQLADYILVGSVDALAQWNERLKMPTSFPYSIPETIFFEIDEPKRVKIAPGKISKLAGYYSAKAIEFAAGLCHDGGADALVTAPIAKEAMHAAGVPFPGHTEMLQHVTNAKNVTMILLSPRMRVALATIHEQLITVPTLITAKNILTKLRLLNETVRIDFATKKPRIAVLGLNPHAGEAGMFGDEEQKIIAPAIRAAQKTGIAAEGPFPADGFFARWTPLKYDAILAMYHDQGLIPLKMDAHNEGVNFSANLPIVRTSPDHGTAFDIAGKNIAKETSFVEAIKVAIDVAKNRKKLASSS